MRFPFCTYFEVQHEGNTHKYYTKRILTSRTAIFHLCVVSGINLPDIHCITLFQTLEFDEVNTEDAIELT